MDVERQLGIRERAEGVVGPTRLKAVGPTRCAVRDSRGGSGGGTAIGSSGGDGRIVGFHGGKGVAADGNGLLVKGGGWRVGKVVATVVARIGSGAAGDKSRQGAESRRPPGARRRRSVVLRCDGFQSAAELRGRLPAACPKGLAGAPRVPSVGSGRSAREDFSCVRPQWPGWDGWAQPAERNGRNAVRRGWQRRRHRDDTGPGGRCGPLGGPRCFLGKNPSFSLGFPGRGLGFRKTKNPLPGGSGLRMRSLGAPQFFHFPCAAAARFVVVTWLICQEATACRRTKARRQPMVWEAGAEMVCIVQFMEGVIAGSVPIVCGR